MVTHYPRKCSKTTGVALEQLSLFPWHMSDNKPWKLFKILRLPEGQQSSIIQVHLSESTRPIQCESLQSIPPKLINHVVGLVCEKEGEIEKRGLTGMNKKLRLRNSIRSTSCDNAGDIHRVVEFPRYPRHVLPVSVLPPSTSTIKHKWAEILKPPTMLLSFVRPLIALTYFPIPRWLNTATGLFFVFDYRKCNPRTDFNSTLGRPGAAVVSPEVTTAGQKNESGCLSLAAFSAA